MVFNPNQPRNKLGEWTDEYGPPRSKKLQGLKDTMSKTDYEQHVRRETQRIQMLQQVNRRIGKG